MNDLPAYKSLGIVFIPNLPSGDKSLVYPESYLEYEKIAKALEARLKEHKLYNEGSFRTRPPGEDFSHDWETVSNWHQDSGGAIMHIAVWASVYPTEIRSTFMYLDKIVNPFELVVFDNTIFEHRIPLEALARQENENGPIKMVSNRWFSRAIGIKSYKETRSTL